MDPSFSTKISELAEEDRPREKLLLRGKSSLSDAELIAILIGSGTKTPGCEKSLCYFLVYPFPIHWYVVDLVVSVFQISTPANEPYSGNRPLPNHLFIPG